MIKESDGLTFMGIQGYAGHLMHEHDKEARRAGSLKVMEMLAEAKARAESFGLACAIVTGGGTGTYDVNTVATEIQAGSYALMDTAYAKLGLPFEQALFVWATVISVSANYAVADAGLKALGMDHGNPAIDGARVWFCSDEHITFASDPAARVGDRFRIWPAHVDPTVAYHERILLVQGEEVVDELPVDLRGW